MLENHKTVNALMYNYFSMKRIEKVLLALIIIVCVMSCQKKEDMDNYNLNIALVLRLINEQRTAGCKCGEVNMPPVPTLKWNNLLAKAAYNHSVDMATRQYFSHTSPDGRSAGDRIKAVGYSYSMYGENIANGYSDEKSVVKAWMQSPAHCTNIMNKNFTEIGAGREAKYWTMIFAHPAQNAKN